MTSATTVPRPPAFKARVGFADILASEWTKLRSIRATYIQAVLAVALGIGMSALVCLAIGSSYDDLSQEDRAAFAPSDVSAFSAIFPLIALIVLGVTFVSSEYTSGMVRLTFATTPRRLRVLAAKTLIVLAVSLVLGFITAFTAFPVGQAVLGAYEGVPTASLSDKESLESVTAVWFTMPVFPLLGVATAVWLRSTASTITVILGLLFIPAIFGGLLPESLQEGILRYLPTYAIDSFTDPDPESTTYLSRPAALGVIALWLASAYGSAYYYLTRRDV